MSATRDQAADASLRALPGKYLTFFLGDEEYGIAILEVQEIIGVLPITRLPRTPPFVRGVVNLRGRVISIVDLRRKLGMPEREPGPRSCIIVVHTGGAPVGLLVDRVSEVADITAADMEPPPALEVGLPDAYLLGIGKSGPRVRLLLDIARVLSTRDPVAVSPIDRTSPAAASAGDA